MYCNSTDGTDPSTVFSFFGSNSLLVDVLQPGQSVLMQSKLTGKYCRTVPVGTTDLNIFCDVINPAQARAASLISFLA